MKTIGQPNADEIFADPEKSAVVIAEVTDDERDSAKPANFGLPAGMGLKALISYARTQFDVRLTESDAQKFLTAWLATFPEMRAFRESNINHGLRLSRVLRMTYKDYLIAQGDLCFGSAADDYFGWVGGMALKVLHESLPRTNKGRPYSAKEIDFFWTRLQPLGDFLEPNMAIALRNRQPSGELCKSVINLLERSAVLTMTGRLRANVSHTECRNTVFQGVAADGAKLALYRLWRNGFRVVAFIHDEVVVEVPATCELWTKKDQINIILAISMKEVCPDIRIDIKGAFRQSWSNEQVEVD